MSEKTEQSQLYKTKSDSHKMCRSPDYQPHNVIAPGTITRERSFVRTSNQQNINKRRSLAFNLSGSNQQTQQRGKPAMDIYRPPNVRGDGSNAMNKLNVHAQEFTMMSNTRSPPPGDAISPRSPMVYPTAPTPGLLTQVKQRGGMHQQIQYVAPPNSMVNRRQLGISLGNVPYTGINSKSHQLGHRPILVTHSHPIQVSHISGSVSPKIPLMNSPSSGNILHQTAAINRVKFAPEPNKVLSKAQQNQAVQMGNNNEHQNYPQQYLAAGQQFSYVTNGAIDPHSTIIANQLQRSKSLSSADTLTRGFAGLGLALGNEVTDIGQFTLEIQAIIDTALENPNKLNSRCLMDLTSHFIRRAVESRRYALPISRLCLNIIAKEQKETFLEALLNTCRQWYQEREKLLFTIQGMKSPARVRFTAFMAFLTEMFCQLKRRQLQLRTQCEGASPPLVLLTLLSKCCEDCVKPPVRSLSEIECLFYVLTCIGQDMEKQMHQQLEILLSLVRDAFLNADDSAPAIRRTLLQLIELQASHWQLPGNTVLYYYPSSK